MNRRCMAFTAALVFLVGIALPSTAVAQQKQQIGASQQTIQQPVGQQGKLPGGSPGRGQVFSEEEEDIQMRPRPDRAIGPAGGETGRGTGSSILQTPQEARIEPGDHFAPGNR